MLHLADGTLRRSVDDLAALPSSAKEHLLACKACRGLAEEARIRAERVSAIFAASGSASAFAADGAVALDSKRFPSKWFYIAASVVAACLVFAFYAPLRTLAAGFVTEIRNQVLRPVEITVDDAQRLARRSAASDPSRYSPEHVKFVGYLDKREAERVAGQVIATPRYVPASLSKGYVIFHVRGAQRYSQRIAELNATLTRTLPSIVEQTYGEAQAYDHQRGFSKASIGVLPIPQGYIDVTQRPIAPLQIVGATEDQVRDYLRARASEIPSVASAMRQGVDPLDHMILLRSDVQRIRSVTIRGVSGYVVENTRGAGNVLLWQQGGMMHMVAGSFAVDDLLKVAQSLHD
jgi:hypothetical protein